MSASPPPTTKQLAGMSKAEKLALLGMLEKKESQLQLAAARKDPLAFAHKVYPGFKEGPHHRTLAKIFMDIAAGKKRRVIVNVAPRHGKSEFASYLFPAWFLGRFPQKKVIMATHTASLSEDYGRRVRNLIATDADYKAVFPDVSVADDQKSAGQWSTTYGGQ